MNIWIYATKPQTLAISLASVVVGTAMGISKGYFSLPVLLVSLLVMLFAHIAFNISIEYYGYKYHCGKRCIVSEHSNPDIGIISTTRIRRVIYALMAVVCLLGASLYIWGGWKVIVVGVICLLGGYLYNGGPYPLARNGLGELFVFLFFGFIPVTMIARLHGAPFCQDTLATGFAIGLIETNWLIIHDCRDILEDKLAGKRTLTVKLGKRHMAMLYLLNGMLAIAILYDYWLNTLMWHVTLFPPVTYLITHIMAWNRIALRNDEELVPVIIQTTVNIVLFAGLFTILLLMLTKQGL